MSLLFQRNCYTLTENDDLFYLYFSTHQHVLFHCLVGSWWVNEVTQIIISICSNELLVNNRWTELLLAESTYPNVWVLVTRRWNNRRWWKLVSSYSINSNRLNYVPNNQIRRVLLYSRTIWLEGELEVKLANWTASNSSNSDNLNRDWTFACTNWSAQGVWKWRIEKYARDFAFLARTFSS